MKRISLLCATLLCVCTINVNVLHADDTREIKILFTSQLNSQIDPFQIVVEGEEENTTKSVGGYSRIAQIIDQERDENTFVLDAGNYSVGTYYASLNESDAININLLEQMGYDVIALGNDEYELDESVLNNMLQASNVENSTILSGNVKLLDEEGNLADTLNNKNVIPSVIVEKNDIKVGVMNIVDDVDGSIGTTTNILNHVQDQVDFFESQDVDYIIALASISEDVIEQIAYHSEEVNLIISNRQSPLKQYETIHKTTVVSNGQKGMYVGEINIDLNDNSVNNYILIENDETIGSHAGVAESIKLYQTKINDAIFKPYGYSYTDSVVNNPYEIDMVDQTTFGSTTIGNIVSDAYRFAYNAWYENWYYEWSTDRSERIQAMRDQIASELEENPVEEVEEGEEVPVPTEDPRITSIRNEEPTVKSNAIGIERKSNIIGTLPTGSVTVGDCYNLVKGTSDPVALVFMSGNDIRHIAEFDATYARNMNTSYELVISGIKYEYNDFRSDYNHVEEVYYDTVQEYYVPIKRREMYPVVASVKTLQLLQSVPKLTGNILSITLYDENGNEIENLSDQILQTSNDLPLLKYVSIAQYLNDMDIEYANRPVLYETYQTTQVRKEKNESFGIWNYFKNPSLYIINQYKNIVVYAIAILIAYRIIRTILNRIFIRK